jgi:hypothetical protein
MSLLLADETDTEWCRTEKIVFIILQPYNALFGNVKQKVVINDVEQNVAIDTPDLDPKTFIENVCDDADELPASTHNEYLLRIITEGISRHFQISHYYLL